MKKAFLFFSLISFVSFGQVEQEKPTLTIDSLYSNINENIFKQFIVEFENKSTSEIKNIIENWAATAFVNAAAVQTANTPDLLSYRPILKSSYSTFGSSQELEFTVLTIFELKNNKMRVTLQEVPTLTVTGRSGMGGASTGNWTIKDFISVNGKKFLDGRVINPGGLSSSTVYSQVSGAISSINSYSGNIKNINKISSKGNW